MVNLILLGIFCDKKHIIVCDYSNYRLQIFDFNGNFIKLIKCSSPPRSVYIFNNLIYVLIYAIPFLYIFTFDGKLHSEISLFANAKSICMNSNFIFISYGSLNEIKCYSNYIQME